MPSSSWTPKDIVSSPSTIDPKVIPRASPRISWHWRINEHLRRVYGRKLRSLEVCNCLCIGKTYLQVNMFSWHYTLRRSSCSLPTFLGPHLLHYRRCNGEWNHALLCSHRVLWRCPFAAAESGWEASCSWKSRYSSSMSGRNNWWWVIRAILIDGRIFSPYSQQNHRGNRFDDDCIKS